jgi:F-type H+-transporting ATPase subunit b
MAIAPHTAVAAQPAAPKTTATTAPAEKSAGGLPQFDPQWWAGEAFWFVIIFVVVFALIGKVFTPRIAGTIGVREDKIAGDIGTARRLKEEAEAQAAAAAEDRAKARAKAQALASDAKARANEEIAESRAAEDAKLAESLAAAEVAIRAARDQAMSSVAAIAQDAASAIVERLTGQAPTSQEVAQATAGKA